MPAILALCLFAFLPPALAQAKGPYPDARIAGIPHVRQKPDFCGEACVEMVLRKLGYDVDQDFVFDQSGLDPALGRGCYTRELSVALDRIGFSTGRIGQRVEADDADAQLEAQFAALHADLVAGFPSIVCTHYDESPNTTEHFRLVTGYDQAADEEIYQEPAEADGAARRMGRERFKRLWPLKYDPQRWLVIRFRMKPDRIVAKAQATGPTRADYAQRVMALKKKLAAELGEHDFTFVVEPPFVVIGDEPPGVVRRRAAKTVKWAATKLKQAYFSKDPERILDIWLFADEDSYEKHCEELFGEEPGTPFGYYSDTHHALIMNIATGGGTLVHEIVHPYVEANFPECPAWFNEGLGSLYEQCGERGGEIVGFTNWRLAGLQNAIRKGDLPSFEKLMSTTSHQFYNHDRGTNYAHARYLLYYLQQEGKLRKYYKAFYAARGSDPTGVETLKEILEEDDLAAFQKEWEAWVLKLEFP